MALAIWVRHFFNLRHQGRTVWAIPVSAAVAVVALAFVIAPARSGTGNPDASQPPVPFATVQGIIGARCTTCHSSTPTHEGFSAPPKGIAFDTPDQIRANAALIEQMAVVTQVMPLGNVTGMTDAERATLGAWIAQGAKAP